MTNIKVKVQQPLLIECHIPNIYHIIILLLGTIDSKMNEVLGNFTVELDGRFSQIRTAETNLGDWVCDVIMAATGADVVMINSGQ